MDETKAFQRFNSRYMYLQRHSQVMAVALTKTFNLLRKSKDNGKSICNNLKVKSEKYDKLNEPASEYARIINYSRRESTEYCFVELYNMFTSYMKDILKEMYMLKPKSITEKSHKQITFSKLSEFESIDEITDYMIDEIFRDFENERSTPKLVKKIIGHTKISIPQNISNEAMMYLTMRHLIIHNNSKVDQEYFEKYHNILFISNGGPVPADYENFQKALFAIKTYIATIDKGLIDKGFVKAREKKCN